MIILNVFMSVKPEIESQFVSDMQPLMEKSRAEVGNVFYTLYKQVDQPQKYVFIEHWKDEDAVQAHNATAHFQAFAAKLDMYFDQPLDIKRYED